MNLTRTMIITATLFCGSSAVGQTANTAETAIQSYGARLNNPADTSAQLNARRINNRIDSRIPTRLSTRIERYRVGSTDDPVAAYRPADQGSAVRAFEQANGAGRNPVTPTRQPMQNSNGKPVR